MLYCLKIETPLGLMTAISTEKGVCFLAFDDSKIVKKSQMSFSGITGSNYHLEMLKEQLIEYFEGKRRDFSVSIDMSGTPFQLSVWRSLMSVGYGKTVSYTAQSASIGKSGSVRAVANANAANRIAILIPCHRIVGSNGKLTGYSGGLSRKRWLLEHE